ncbi:MAG: nuclear transport factor 2 family protein [Reyranella sp.]|jgi:2-(1,2-epoxy-1,2-dihydrophenyl)acetyl-CoA isomerase|nr:nuclear transport factor 2 family protein [Reyranella sp.]
MSDILSAGRVLYAALADGDADALGRLLSPAFQGRLTEGLPHGLGRQYDGLEMMMNAWAAADRRFEMLRPEPDELFDGGCVLIARGHYVGKANATGRPLRAAFAHFWPFDGRQFTAVRQITDSGAWRDALEP